MPHCSTENGSSVLLDVSDVWLVRILGSLGLILFFGVEPLELVEALSSGSKSEDEERAGETSVFRGGTFGRSVSHVSAKAGEILCRSSMVVLDRIPSGATGWWTYLMSEDLHYPKF